MCMNVIYDRLLTYHHRGKVYGRQSCLNELSVFVVQSRCEDGNVSALLRLQL